MNEGYNILKQRYEKQLDSREKEHLATMFALKEENIALKNEADNARQQNFTELEMLKMKLSEERENACRLAEHCKSIQFRLDSTLIEINNQHSHIETLNAEHQKLEKHLRMDLFQRDTLINSQDFEMDRLKEALSEKQLCISHLSNQTINSESDLLASKLLVNRLGKAISSHLAIVLGPPNDNAERSTVTSESSAREDQDEMCFTSEELKGKLRLFELQLSDARIQLVEKMSHIRRLESACQTASQTIQRLVKGRSRHADQVAVVTKLLQGSKATAGQLITRVSEMEKHPVNGERIAVSALAIQTEAINDSCNTSIQTDDSSSFLGETSIPLHRYQHLEKSYQLTVRELEAKIGQLTQEQTDLQRRLTHQMSLVEKLQQENLAISDLLTEAESFNRTRISCATDLHRRLSICTGDTPSAVCHVHSPNETPATAMADYHRGCARVTSKSVNFSLPFDDGAPSDLETPTVTSLPCKSESQLSSPSDLHSPLDVFDSQDHLCESTKQKIPQVSPRHRTFNPPISETPVHEPAQYPQVEVDCSPMTSPSEYDDFAIKLPFINPHACRLNNPQGSSTYDQQWTQPQLTREERAIGLPDNHSSLPQNMPEFGGLSSGSDKERPHLVAESVDPDDTSIFSLAAKFLADEQQHSAILEQRIDAHLNALKSRVAGLANPPAAFS